MEIAARLQEGEDKFRAANIQKRLSADSLLYMLMRLADYYYEKGETEKARIQQEIAGKVVEAFREDFLTEGMRNTVYRDRKERMKERCHNV